MNIYSRILGYVGPLKKLAFYYFIAIFFSIFFGLTTYGLVIPLLKILFNQEELNHMLSQQQPLPQWHISIHYFTKVFNFVFIKTIENYGKKSALYLLSSLFTLSTFISGLFRYIADITMTKVRINVVYNLRLALFNKTLTLPLQHFTDKKKGDLMARITTDIQEIEHAVADTLRVFLKEPTQLFCYISVLFYMAPKLSLFTLLLLPIIGWVITTIIKRLRKWANRTQQSLGNLMSLIEETLEGVRIIKVFGAQQYIVDKFKKESQAYAFTNMSVARKEHMTAPISESLSVVAVSTILAYGGTLILLEQSPLTASAFIAYIIICSQTLIPIKMISRSIGHIQRGIAAGSRIFSLLDEESKHQQKLTGVKHVNFEHEIVFKNVSFSYSNEENNVLHQIHLTIKKGETIAIVGASGSGKSTLLSLLSGLYRPTSGEIEIDNMPLPQISTTSLHHLMGVVTQESILFHDTVFNNIAFNRPTYSKEKVIEAAKVAFAHNFIMGLPQGYDTIIGAHGNKLSGGQKQCICIARAILSNPPILVLDEATSALDTASEQNVQTGLKSLIQNKTSIIVSHRLSTICQADKIFVLEQGHLVEQGSHSSLLQQGGIYKKIFSLQKHM
ncbi:ABC transporter ATP-binding protein [Cardinium endosymbiont of Culicoides punctatus]|uniref:ABC transporter ATP-binding protein n=1 Tax=Cardinium endosymbiont of Culicoides punctatus TaxID=2304601 RepID=UPI0010587F05|nr:ABC transporter ATP-binding protein [Cardinium endosymbiont of Culicoides punctatus]TDG95159.1 Lipid A export ATP-binding/permease protein MsbA [Cardinium endosymbiont of Culicoides punctatus]